MDGSTNMATVATHSSGKVSTVVADPISSLISFRVNQDGKFVYIKYHFLAKHGQKQLSEPEAIRISGEDPDYSKRQLWDAIENGEELEWTANVQIMQPDEADAKKLGFDPFDVTKVWPRQAFPVFHVALSYSDRPCSS